MTGIEIPVIGGILGLTIGGVSIQDLLPTAVAFSWKLYLTYKKSTILKKLTKMIISYTEGKYPHKEIFNKTYKFIKNIFKRHSKSDLVQTITYYKEIQELFYAVNFNDAYWNKNKGKLLVNPELMRDYMLKKVYIERIKDIIVVKLYNNVLSKEDLKELQQDLLDTYMNEQITIKHLDKAVSNIEENLKKQYKEQKGRYDKDFKDEKEFIKRILDSSVSGVPRVVKTALLTTKEIVEDCKNNIGEDNYESRFLKRTRSLSKTSTLEPIEETTSSKVLNMLN